MKTLNENICQACGHKEWNHRIARSGEHICQGRKCPCKKFSPQKKQEEIRI